MMTSYASLESGKRVRAMIKAGISTWSGGLSNIGCAIETRRIVGCRNGTKNTQVQFLIVTSSFNGKKETAGKGGND